MARRFCLGGNPFWQGNRIVQQRDLISPSGQLRLPLFVSRPTRGLPDHKRQSSLTMMVLWLVKYRHG
jgi:hypothetical protein